MTIPYFTKGDSPTLLIHAGTHGDEYGVIESVRLAVKKYERSLPNFVYVPTVSPSAVAKRTRFNGEGVDINRNCFEESKVAEIEANFQIVADKKFELMVTFHEDPGPKADFYLYDIGCGLGRKDSWNTFTDELRRIGVGLLNGEDDPGDPILDYTFENGYRYFPAPVEGHNGGSFDAWATRNGVVKRTLVPEIPGHLPQKKKNLIVDLFFKLFLLEA
jgi:hypothetical protein